MPRTLAPSVRSVCGIAERGGPPGKRGSRQPAPTGQFGTLNGTACGDTRCVRQSLRHEIPGLVAVVPDGGKVARAQAVSPQVESGNVYLPHPAIAPWVEAFVEECSTFP